MSEIAKCTICGEPMPEGESMFKYHGYSGACPKPPLLKPHEQRVVTEKAELDIKATALSNFIVTSPQFETLDATDQELLRAQCEVMWLYSGILGTRIGRFTK